MKNAKSWWCAAFVIFATAGVSAELPNYGDSLELQVRSNIVDGFESGDTDGWSATLP